MQRTVIQRLQLAGPTGAGTKAAVSLIFKDVLTSLSLVLIQFLTPVCSPTALLCTSSPIPSYPCSDTSHHNAEEIFWNQPHVCCCPVCSASFSPLSLPHLAVSYLPGAEDSHSRAQSCP